MSNNAVGAYQKVLFLDTNALHYLRLFLDFAAKHNLVPFGNNLENPERLLNATYPKGGQIYKSTRRGLRNLSYLHRQCKEGARAEYSPISELEMIHGLLKGKGVIDAASEGVPSRMWGRLEEQEILDRLMSSGFGDVYKRVQDLASSLQPVGINLQETNRSRIGELWPVSSKLFELIFLDVGDCVVYASSLLASADVIISNDDYFRRVIRNISHPSSLPDGYEKDYYSGVNLTVRQLIADAIGVSSKEEISLPSEANL